MLHNDCASMEHTPRKVCIEVKPYTSLNPNLEKKMANAVAPMDRMLHDMVGDSHRGLLRVRGLSLHCSGEIIYFLNGSPFCASHFADTEPRWVRER